jgi:hypothetical protein
VSSTNANRRSNRLLQTGANLFPNVPTGGGKTQKPGMFLARTEDWQGFFKKDMTIDQG